MTSHSKDKEEERLRACSEELRGGGHYFDEIVNLIERLRAPGGCPWDRKQTLEDLGPHITEEAYELAEAIALRDMEKVKEESGDLLLQVVFVASLAGEKGIFSMEDVVRAICDKLIRRHPHVFGDFEAKDPDAVLKNWEKIKMEERKEKHEALSVLAGVPSGLPPLLRAHRLQGKAAHVGFDWPEGDAGPLFGKLDEEARELREAVEKGDSQNTEEELGDLLFMAVNLARHLRVNPDAALSRACAKFEARFRLVEKLAAERKLSLSDCPLAELDSLWEEAKSVLDGEK